MTKHGWTRTGALLLGLAFTAACSGAANDGESASGGAAVEQAGSPTTGTNLTPDASRTVIAVDMMTDEQGNNRFEPAEFEARKGDVIRYTLVSGVHNANFVADSASTKTGLPPVGPMLQLPQQTYDVKVTMEPGRYFYQCDPHALLGMVGWVTVVP